MSPALRNEAREFIDAISSTNGNVNPVPYLLRTSLDFILLTLSGVRTTSIEDPLFKKATDMIKTSIQYTDFKYIFMQLVNPTIASVARPFILGSNTIDVKKEVFEHYEYILKPFYLEIIEKALESDQDNLAKALNDELNQGKRGYYNNLMPAIRKLLFILMSNFIVCVCVFVCARIEIYLSYSCHLPHIITFLFKNGQQMIFYMRVLILLQ